ncbi:MAG TPA: condensation domain-containing protein, partial [Steroidobacteraceae bacterium]|nr:condensation domain-containing protein [Steroidobacteraceae bacterium]
MATAGDTVYGTETLPDPRREAERRAAELAAAPPPAVSESESEYSDFPCSVAQERFWLLDRLEPGNPAYNVAVRWRLEGEVSKPLLERAWNEILARHEILRTRFLEVDGSPVQRVAAHATLKLSEIELEALAPEARAAESDRIGLIEARAPFDLSTGPLIRVVLLRHSPQLAIILVTTHQMVSDGWSIGVMAREMGSLYEALRAGRDHALPELRIQYGDYARWQLEWLRQRGTDAETQYWSRQLEGVKPFEVVPDRLRPAVPTTSGTIASLVLPRELTDRMHAISAARGVTLFATAVSTLCATLARYTGKSEVVIGTQVSERDQVELEPMIGQFVNSLILRNDLRGDPHFTDLMERVSATITEALEHRHIPIEQLLGMLKTGRGGSSSPPISVNFIFQRTFIENRRYGDFTLVDMPSLPAGAIYDLNFFMVERHDGWRFSCQYNTDQFEARTAERLLHYFQSVLRSAVDSPERRLSDLRLADPAEVLRLATRLTGPTVAHPQTQTVAAQFAARAELIPDSIAIVHGERRFTFWQLEAQAQVLAQRLQALGAGAGTRVALALERSPELIVAILATWKAGAAYVALEPRGSEPLQELIDASGARVVLTNAALASTLQAPGGVITDLGAASPARGALPTLTAASPAAVWFARHEHGGLAGVEVAHLGLLNMLTGVQMRVGLNSADTVIALGTSAPESAPVELLLPLLHGARVAVATAEEAAHPHRLAQLFRRMGVRVVHAAPEVWPALLAALPRGRHVAKVLFKGGT